MRKLISIIINHSITIRASDTSDLDGILSLQKRNLPKVLSKFEQNKEGFVSVEHDFKILEEMNRLNAHTIALDQDQVVGYALAMDKSFGQSIPLLIPMFDKIKEALAKPKQPEAGKYLVMGQVCIAKGYRGQGLFKSMYENLKERFHNQYTSVITEVATRNKRSIQAHHKQGFKTLVIHRSDGEEWEILQWIW